MKTRSLCTISSLCGVALALFIINGPQSTLAADQVKGAQLLLHISTRAEADSLKAGDTIAMVCSKCKSAMIHNVSTEKGHITVMTVGAKHMCPGCGSTITTVGTGKGAKDEVKHVCDKCGSDSVFCCATKPGNEETKGMDK